MPSPKFSLLTIQEVIDKRESFSEEYGECLTFNEFQGFLDKETIERIKQQVLVLDDTFMAEVNRVLAKYYAIAFPAAYLREALSEDLEFPLELVNGAFSDTYVRTGFFTHMMRKCGAYVPAVQDENYAKKALYVSFPYDFIHSPKDEVVAKMRQQIEQVGGTIILTETN